VTIQRVRWSVGEDIMSNNLRQSQSVTFFLIFSIFLFIVLGFLGGSRPKCTGEVTVGGTRYEGMDNDIAKAKRNACSKYCIEGDPTTDSMYRIWFDSLPEKERKRVRKGAKGKWDALYKNERIKRHVIACEKKCLAEQTVTAKCGK